MIVSVRGKWKWPIGYFLKNGMSSTTLSELIRTALILISEKKLKITSITCDAERINIAALNILGCTLFPRTHNHLDIVNYFKHPTQDYNIYVVLDACHMLKLARNALADYGEFQYNNKSISWSYILRLHNFQNTLTFKLKNKLSSQCINWQQNKMKVKYAATTFSSSVANAIKFLNHEGFKEFENSEATILFIETIDRLFDFLNTRNAFGKHFKQPLTVHNFHFLQTKIQKDIEYLFLLKTKDGQFLKTTSRKTFLYGLTIAAKSILAVSKELLFAPNTLYKYILTYKFSQDYIELLFAKIRSCNGYNNNPSALQLLRNIRKILLRNSITNYSNSNCLELESDPLGCIFDYTWKKKIKESDFSNIEEIEEEMSESEMDDTSNNSVNIEPLQENMLYYIAGYIVKKLHYINCYHCAQSLVHINTEHNYIHFDNYSKFFDFSNNGGLVRPFRSVYKIILETDKQIKIFTKDFSQFTIKNLSIKVITQVKNILTLDNFIFRNLNCDNSDILEIPHKTKLITAIAQRYLKIRFHSYAKFYTQEVLKPIRKRHVLSKQILFASE